MAAIPENALYLMREQVVKLKNRVLNPILNDCVLTFDDYYELFVPSEHHAEFKRIIELIEIEKPRTLDVAWPLPGGPRDVTVWLYSEDQSRIPLIPRIPKLQLDCRPELLRRVTGWVAQVHEIQASFRTVRFVLGELATECNTPAQVRWYFPQITAIASLAGLHEFNDKTKGTAKRVPSLSPQLREKIREAAGICAGAQLLSEADPWFERKGEVQLNVQ